MLVVLKREYVLGHTRESARTKWEGAFDEEIWDYLEKTETPYEVLSVAAAPSPPSENPVTDTDAKPNMLTVYRQEFLKGQPREGAKAQWGKTFDEKAWDYVEKIGCFDPEEEAARPQLRDILKWEYDHPHPRNEALDKWGAEFEAIIERNMARGTKRSGKRGAIKGLSPSADTPQLEGPDFERE